MRKVRSSLRVFRALSFPSLESGRTETQAASDPDRAALGLIDADALRERIRIRFGDVM
jgi:hypothetical protein